MEFFLEMLFTVVVALLLSFPVAKLVSVATAGDGNDTSSEDEFVMEEVRFSNKMDGDFLYKGKEVVIAEEKTVLVAKEIIGEIDSEREELMVRTDSSVLSENVVSEEQTILQGQEERSEVTEITIFHLEKEESGDSEEVRVEQSNTNTIEENTEEEEELSIEEGDEDDWEGIERSELEKAFVVAAKVLEESGKGEEISGEVKMELYGLYKIATEGSCREGQPMAIMVSARAKWNAWQTLGNMSQEEAMEKYLTLISKEIPGFMNPDHTVGKMTEMETTILLPPNSGPITEHPATLETVESAKKGER